MIISAISRVSLMVGDERVVEVSGEVPPERISRIMARLQYQTRLLSNPITLVGIGSAEHRVMRIMTT